MTSRWLSLSLALFSWLMLSTAGGAAPLEGKRPNIIFILTDDQGYGDLSVHGNPVLKTPNLDRMHAESVRFTNWHNSPTCAPTRSALLTGRHEFRNGITHTILERERLRLDSVTLAQVLQKAGYATGIFGKWHLGDEEAYRPDKRGFDETFIHGAGGIGQSYPGSCGDAPGNSYFDPAILHNGKFEKTKGYCTDVFFTQATKWIESTKSQKDKPFLCWLSTNAPHGPYIAKPEDRALYEGKTPNEAVANFFGMLHNIDENVGKLLAKLDEWGIAENTLVIFMNDNGGTAGVQVFNADMHGSKGSPWIGGVRAISFWRWKGTLKPANCNALAAHIDFFRTLSSIAGVKLDEAMLQQSAEARNLVPLLEDSSAKWDDRFLFAHVGRWPKGTSPDAAKLSNASVRNTQYTLVSEVARGPKAPKNAGPRWQLFDVIADPAQKTDIAATHPDVVKKLTDAYDAWWSSLKGQYDLNENAVGPRLNPFAELYWKQFGGGPTPEDYERMDPDKAKTFEANRQRQVGGKKGAD
ncbi:arylsulfatase [Roseimicrobium gellanilyticum]|nr:arylsulfatase [Roseimicrobium gellanilyticum]